MAIILVFLIALVAVAPPVWARIEPIITHWFSFSSPDGESSAAIGGFKAFTPYYATYIPEGFQQSLLGSTTFMEPEVESLEIGYDSEERFIVLIQSKGAGVTGLPTGESAWINANPAIFIPSYATSQTDLREKQPTLSIDTNYDYENTNLLAWFAGEIKIEILSNLPLEEMMRVAESLESMQDSEGEAPGIQ
jgi:hypothetical protein